MDADSLYIACYGEASLSNNPDKVSSQIGGVVALRDKCGNVQVLSWFSKKYPRVVSSILAGETIAAVTVFDLAFAIQHALEEATQRKLELELFLFTDSYSLFQTIIRYQSVREKRLLVDHSILRQGYRKKEIANVGFVLSEYMVADPMTKICRNALLDEAMRTGKLDDPVAEYIAPDDRSVDTRILYAGLV
jgi:hypothetical protein